MSQKLCSGWLIQCYNLQYAVKILLYSSLLFITRKGDYDINWSLGDRLCPSFQLIATRYIV